MGVIKGLANIHKHVEDSESRRGGGDGPKVRWFKLQDKQAAKVVFLGELDEDSENFSKKNGLSILAVEHQHPDDHKRKALCSFDDEGACFACEQARAHPKTGWHQRTKFYANVLVDDGVDEPYVAVISAGMSGRAITPTLLEYAADDGTITDKYFNIRRSGSGISDTSYTIRAGKEHGLNVEDYEVYDLEDKVLRNVPYAEQEAFYMSGHEQKEETQEDSSATSSSAQW